MNHSDGQTILEVSHLKTSIGSREVLKDISFSVQKGETIAIIGETGSGKSITVSSIFNLLDTSKAIVSADRIFLVNHPSPSDALPTDAAIVFQNPQLSLNPIIKCGRQIYRIIRKNLNYNRIRAVEHVEQLFEKVGLKEVKKIYNAYPHQLSGGELQRVMIAMGLSCNPQLLILDEPTASLDMLVQAKIVDLLTSLKTEAFSIIIITHDLELASNFADRIIHIDNGKIIANQETGLFFKAPEHDLSKKLLNQLQEFRIKPFARGNFTTSLINVENLGIEFNNGKKAFCDLSFELLNGENLGIIGESGSGKTSLGKCIAGILKPTTGEIKCNIDKNKISYVYQDAYNSVDPDLTIKQVLHEVIRLQENKVNLIDLLASVSLPEEILSCKISELSGGQRQRINLARSLASNPSVLICDEITSGLDLNVQMEIVELLAQKGEELSIIFISHDLSLVKNFCHRVLIMREGALEFDGKTVELFNEKQNGYTKELINSIYKVKYFLNRPV